MTPNHPSLVILTFRRLQPSDSPRLPEANEIKTECQRNVSFRLQGKLTQTENYKQIETYRDPRPPEDLQLRQRLSLHL